MTSKALHYYNELDPYAAAWIKSLCAAGELPPAAVQIADIRNVQSASLSQFIQCHFFAGIAGWPLALRLAGWPDDWPVWTGSCPCQPLSRAGTQLGMTDERHLWPIWFRLICECKPSVIFGEQVNTPAGRDWLAVVQLDLEDAGYAVARLSLPAASVGAPHQRSRSYFVDSRLAHTFQPRLERLSEPIGTSSQPGRLSAPASGPASPSGSTLRLENSISNGREQAGCDPTSGAGEDAPGGADRSSHGSQAFWLEPTSEWSRSLDVPWRTADWLGCRDGRWRPVEPGTFPLAHGVPNRVDHLRALGNAIVPQVAATFIRAFLDTLQLEPESNPPCE